MEKILKTYITKKKQVQIIIRDKTFEGVIENIQEKIVYLVGDKYEYHIPIEQILTIGAKLNKEKRVSFAEKSDRVGFKQF